VRSSGGGKDVISARAGKGIVAVRRADAMQRLRAVQTSHSAQELIESLEDSSPEVVRATIGQLVDLKGELARLLSDPVARVRARAVRAVARLVTTNSRSVGQASRPAQNPRAPDGSAPQSKGQTVVARRCVVGERRTAVPSIRTFSRVNRPSACPPAPPVRTRRASATCRTRR